MSFVWIQNVTEETVLDYTILVKNLDLDGISQLEGQGPLGKKGRSLKERGFK